jgi:hypothetical protein
VAQRAITVFLNDEDQEHELPCKMSVCPKCEGRGKHVNPNIDDNGLTAEDFEEAGDSFREDYMAGVYDVTCEMCGGVNVVPVVDLARCTKEEKAAYLRKQREDAEYEASVRMERRYGA